MSVPALQRARRESPVRLERSREAPRRSPLDSARGERIGPIAATLALAALTFGAVDATSEARFALNLPEPLVPTGAAPQVAPALPRHQVLFIVVDGLGEDAAKTLPTLSRLAEHGATAELVDDPPTLSAPQYVSLLAGVPPVDSGVRTNQGVHPLALDTVPARVLAQGRQTVGLSEDTDWWWQLFPNAWTRTALTGAPYLSARASAEQADFVLAHIVRVDHAGHAAGSASERYREASTEADQQIAEMVRAWTGPGKAVVIAADHGHMPRGGHGGEESPVRRTWLVMVGDGIHAGARVPHARPADMAPTLSALLGAPAPSSAEGQTLSALLALSPEARQAVERADRERQARVESAREVRSAELVRGERSERLFRSAALLALLASLGWLAWRSRAARVGIAAGLACAAAFWIIHGVVWGLPSFSQAKIIGDVPAQVGVLALGCAAAVLIALAAAFRPRASGRQLSAFAIGFVSGSGAVAALTFAVIGAAATRLSCGPGWWAALPLVAYPALASTALVGAAIALAASIRSLRSA